MSEKPSPEMREWLDGIDSSTVLYAEIHEPGQFQRTKTEWSGNTPLKRAGRKYIELAGDKFDGTISRQTGLGRDSRGRTCVISPYREPVQRKKAA